MTLTHCFLLFSAVFLLFLLQVLYQYPEIENEHKDFRIHVFKKGAVKFADGFEQLPTICFPNGIALSERVPDTQPQLTTFVITREDASRVYGTYLIYWDRVTDSATAEPTSPPLSANRNQTKQKQASSASNSASASASNSPTTTQMFAPKALMLLSHWPFCNSYKAWLQVLYRMASVTVQAGSAVPGMQLC